MELANNNQPNNTKKELAIYRPLYTKNITQGFGQNLACAKTNALKQPYRPFQIISSYQNGLCPLGSQPFYPLIGLKGHNGLDFKAWKREPIFHSANFDGWAKTEKDPDGGIGVDIISNEPILEYEGKMHYIKIRNWHCHEIIVHDGQKVKMGDPIALAGNTGASSGVHLHFGLKICNKDGRNTIIGGNGYYGAINPAPYYYNELMVREILGLSQEKLDTAQKVARVIYGLKSGLNSLLNK